jgi:protein-S-isoprenylcysteine O-methyltransferase Ste14
MRPTSVAMGTVFLTTVFVLFPVGAIYLNGWLGWPRWQLPAGPVLGGGLMVAGLAVILHCTGLFSRLGRGTPVPIEPPDRLVIRGIYRYCRNPMYLGQLALLLGLFVYRGEALLLVHLALYAGVVRAYVVRWEEPELRRRFGEEYLRYLERVPRWLPRRPPDEDGATTR